MLKICWRYSTHFVLLATITAKTCCLRRSLRPGRSAQIGCYPLHAVVKLGLSSRSPPAPGIDKARAARDRGAVVIIHAVGGLGRGRGAAIGDADDASERTGADGGHRPRSIATIEVGAGAAGRRKIARADAGQARSRSAKGRSRYRAGDARASGGNRQASRCNRQSAAAYRRRGHSGRRRQHHAARSGRGRRALDRRAAGCRAEIRAGQRAKSYGRVRAHADPDRAVAIGHDVLDAGILHIAFVAGRAGAGSEGWVGGEQNCCCQCKQKLGEFRSRHHCF